MLWRCHIDDIDINTEFCYYINDLFTQIILCTTSVIYLNITNMNDTYLI
jgi:hypothetical protein